MLSYCARLCALAPDETNNAALAASHTNFEKLFIKTISARDELTTGGFRVVPSAGQDVAKNGRHRGEISAPDADVNQYNGVTLTLCVRCIASVDANLRHADAQECRAKVAVKV
jgi:hypothetical protein